MPPKVLLKNLHGFGQFLGSITGDTKVYVSSFSLSLRSCKMRTFPNVVLVTTAKLPVLTLCLSKNLASFSLFSGLKETCKQRLETLVMGLIQPCLLIILHRLSIYPSVRILSSSMQSMTCASVITRSASVENPIRT